MLIAKKMRRLQQVKTTTRKSLLRSIIRAMLGGGQKIPRVIGVTFIQLLAAEDSLITDNSEIF